jgi:hypothetical protein
LIVGVECRRYELIDCSLKHVANFLWPSEPDCHGQHEGSENQEVQSARRIRQSLVALGQLAKARSTGEAALAPQWLGSSAKPFFASAKSMPWTLASCFNGFPVRLRSEHASSTMRRVTVRRPRTTRKPGLGGRRQVQCQEVSHCVGGHAYLAAALALVTVVSAVRDALAAPLPNTAVQDHRTGWPGRTEARRIMERRSFYGRS